MMTGMWCVAGSALRRRHTSKPSTPGIITSSSTMSHGERAQIASASSPLPAVTTSKYSAESCASSSFTLAGTSSTTRTRAVIHALLQPDRFHQIAIYLFGLEHDLIRKPASTFRDHE